MATNTNTKIDLKKELKPCYSPSAKQFAFVEVPPINFIMIDGVGDPGTSEAYADAVGALFAVAYTTKFTLKKTGGHPDFAVMPLETLWWADDMDDYISGRRDRWKWTAMIAQPAFVSKNDIEAAKAAAAAKKSLPAIDGLRFEQFAEGQAAQILYLGPYADEGPTIAALHQFIADGGKERRGLHHEIYLSDARRTAPEKLKTIIRQPVT